MNATRIGSVCSGYEGLGMAVQEVLGGELAWVADNDPGAAALLAHHFPAVKNLGDITGVDWSSVEPVEVQAGGFPCQDISNAGARAGLRHGNRSGLWHEFVKAIAAQRPRMVVIENVSAILTARGDEPTPEHLAAEASRDAAGRLLRWLDGELDLAVSKGDVRRARAVRARAARVTKARKRAAARCVWHEQRLIRAIGTVLVSLASLGYDAEWVVVTALAAGACHRRARMFILAFPDAGRVIPGEPVAVIRDGTWMEPLESLFGAAPFTGRVPASGRMAGGRIYAAEAGPTEAGTGLLPTPQVADSKHAEPTEYELAAKGDGQPYGDLLHTATARLLATPMAHLATNGGSQHPDKRKAGGHTPTLADQVEHELLPTPTAAAQLAAGTVDWGPYEAAIRRWEAVLGRLAPPPTVPGKTGERLNPALPEWMMGLPEGWITGVPGLSRNAMLKLAGNGCVPQQVTLALRILLARAGISLSVEAAA